MIRLILIALLLFVVTRLIFSFSRPRRRDGTAVRGRPAQSKTEVPADRIQDAKYKDIPDKS